MERPVPDWEFMLVEMSSYKDSYYRKKTLATHHLSGIFFFFVKSTYAKLKLLLACKHGAPWEHSQLGNFQCLLHLI